jgi:hypothetical protein
VKTFYEKFITLQHQTKVTKDQYNQFGKYSYRKTEDILAEIKPICAELGLFVTLHDSVELVGDRYYLVAVATISDGEKAVSSKAYAREDDKQAGMAAPQVTGSSSSYARKYALSGLLGLDDEKDSDDTNTHGKQPPKEKSAEAPQKEKVSGGEEFTTKKEWAELAALAERKGLKKAPFAKTMQQYREAKEELLKMKDA